VLYIGILFTAIGLYLIIEDVYDLTTVISKREIIKRGSFVLDDYYKLKASIGIFSIVVGIFSIVNYLS